MLNKSDFVEGFEQLGILRFVIWQGKAYEFYVYDELTGDATYRAVDDPNAPEYKRRYVATAISSK